MDARLECCLASSKCHLHVRCERCAVKSTDVDAPWHIRWICNGRKRTLFDESEKSALSYGRHQRFAVGCRRVHGCERVLIVFAISLHHHGKNAALFATNDLLDGSAHRR